MVQIAKLKITKMGSVCIEIHCNIGSINNNIVVVIIIIVIILLPSCALLLTLLLA